MSKRLYLTANKLFFSLVLIFISLVVSQPVHAQSSQSNQFRELRSDVGINGLTANFHFLSKFTYLGNDTLQNDGSSELEIVYRDVRMMSPRLGIGFQVLGSFFTDGANSGFGIGSWGLGPVFRAYPFKTERFQPYFQANALFGKDLAVSKLANTQEGRGFRIRLGLRGGLAARITPKVGLFSEIGYDWESSSLFKADARALQFNLGVDLYLFN
ncbi:MAG: hypothetical protein PVH63_09755 [Balneolaceae bacterium]|jgi:hypothetical protein